MSPAEPAIDFTQIQFPSDRLTVKALRKTIPHSFDLPARENFSRYDRKGFFKRESLENYLGGIINTEREIAALAFHAALGNAKPPSVLGPRSGAIEALVSDYVVVGLTQGEHEGHELIRHIETQAAAQAQRYLGNAPRR